MVEQRSSGELDSTKALCMVHNYDCGVNSGSAMMWLPRWHGDTTSLTKLIQRERQSSRSSLGEELM